MLICKTSPATHANLPFFISEGGGTWTEWGDWSECDPSSSGGNKFRFRKCYALSSAACDGDPIETAPCPSVSTKQPTNTGFFFNIWATEMFGDLMMVFLFAHFSIKSKVHCMLYFDTNI